MTEWWEQILQGGQDVVQTVIGAGQQAEQVVTDQSQRVVQSIQQAPQQAYDFGQQVTQPVVTPIVNTLQSNPMTQTVRPTPQQIQPLQSPQNVNPLDNTPVRGRGAVTTDIIQGGYRAVTMGATDSLGWIKYPFTKQSVFPVDRPGAQDMGFDKSGRSLQYGEFSKWGGGVSQQLIKYGAPSPESSQKQIDRYGSVLDNPRSDIIAKADAYINRFGWSANKAVVEHPESLVVVAVQAVALEPVFGVASVGIEGLAVRGAAKMGASVATQLAVRSASKYVLPAVGLAVIGGEVTKNDSGMWFSDFSAKNTSFRGGQIAPSVAVFAGTSMALSGRSFITDKPVSVKPSAPQPDYFKGYKPKAKPDIEGGGGGSFRTEDGFGNKLERGTAENPFAGYKPKPKPDIEGGSSGRTPTVDGFGNTIERGSPSSVDNPYAGYKPKPKPDIPGGGGTGEPTVDGFGQTILKRKPTQTTEEYYKMMQGSGLKQRGDTILETRAPKIDTRMLRPSGAKTQLSMKSFGKAADTKGVVAFKQARGEVWWEEMAGRTTTQQKQPTVQPVTEEQMFSWMTVQKQKPALKYDMGQAPIEKLKQDTPRVSVLVQLQKFKIPIINKIGEPQTQREKTILVEKTITVPRPPDIIQVTEGGGGGGLWTKPKPFPKIGAVPIFGGGFGGGGEQPLGKLKREKWSRKNKTAAALPGWYFKDLDASKGKKRGLAKAFDTKGSPF